VADRGPRKVAEGIDIAKLQDFSRRLKLIRDKVFVHIDKDAVFDSSQAYRDAAIRTWEIEETSETLWMVLDGCTSSKPAYRLRV
jgi:hypothetical protein